MHWPGYYEYCGRGRIVSGFDALERIPALLAELKAARPMLVTDKGVSAAGLLETVRGALGSAVAIAALEDEVPPDSDFETVRRIAGNYRSRGCDALIAVGGGSVLDTAKGVNILVSENADDLMAFSGAGALKRRLRPLIAVPTTAGTGSEVTLVAVIADRQRQRKNLFTSYVLLPDIAVLDPRMTLTLPPHLTAQTAMDALTHAMEAYTCLAKNPISDAAAWNAIALIGRHLPAVVRAPDDRAGRLALANAATLAGLAFSNAMVGMVHTLGHAVGGVCGAPHGACMAALLPYGLEYNLHKNGGHTAELLLPLAGAEIYAQTPRHLRAEKVIAHVRQLNLELHQATAGRHARFLKEMTGADGAPMVPRELLAAIAEKAVDDGSIFYNPEELDRDDCRMVLQAAWEGIPLDLGRILER